jgi:hypothetical protein
MWQDVVTDQRADVGEFLVGCDEDRLDEELITALCVWRRVLLHGLEKDLDLYIFAGLNASAVGAHTVSAGATSARAAEDDEGCKREQGRAHCLGAVVLTCRR